MKPDNYSSKSTNSVGWKKTLETLPRGWISLSEDELIEAYNCAQSVISRKAIKVSISDLKGRQFSNLGVLLDEQRKGNYCVIVTEKGDSWLLPKVHFRINSFNKDTLKSLFEFNGSFSEDAREFSLVKLAKVSLMPGGDYWQLEKRGELHFGENSQLFQLHSELEGVKQEREKLESELRLARNERDRFASQVAELTYESLKKTYERLEKILAKLEEGDCWQSNLTECLERLEQAGSFQEKRFSNLEAEFQRLAQLKPELSEKLSQLQSQLSKLEKSEINNIYQLQELTQKQKKLFLQQILEELEKGKLFYFEVVKVNQSGEIISRNKQSARQKIEDLGDGIELEMVKIPGGRFLMGSPDTEASRGDREGPQHYVDVPEFLMGKYVVTQGQWKAIASRTDLKVELDLKTEPSYFKEPYKDIDRWNRPVESVSWYQTVEFCKRLSRLTGRNYRLPSEAEWEYACRAGTTTPFHFGETINTELANYRGTDDKKFNWSGSYGDGPKGEYRKQTTPVGQFPANAFGLYDMHGNVWEWCADGWHENYAGAPTDGSVWLNEDKDRSPVRGGSWVSNPNYCRSAIRLIYLRRDVHSYYTGFRLVCDGGRIL